MDHSVIKIRRHEVSQEIERLQDRLKELDAELADLDTAERVFARLTGAKWEAHSAPDQSGAPPPSEPGPKNTPTIRAMIKEALMDARQRGLPGLAPRHIREYVRKTYRRDIKQQANTAASRMWRETKEIGKNEDTGLFYILEKEGGKPESKGMFDT